MTERLLAYERVAAQPDMFGTELPRPLRPAPFEFYYRYQDDDGSHECRCHDWEVEQTYINWERKYGEKATVDLMQKKFGQEYPAGGMVFAMGTHSAYPDVWMIIGIVRMLPNAQPSFL